MVSQLAPVVSISVHSVAESKAAVPLSIQQTEQEVLVELSLHSASYLATEPRPTSTEQHFVSQVLPEPRGQRPEVRQPYSVS